MENVNISVKNQKVKFLFRNAAAAPPGRCSLSAPFFSKGQIRSGQTTSPMSELTQRKGLW